MLNRHVEIQDKIYSVVPDEADMAGEIQSIKDSNNEECEEGDVKMTKTDQGRERE